MKKALIVLITFFLFQGSFGQNVPIDFEGTGNGASWTWTVFENDLNPPLGIVANPDTTGINCSPTVAMFTANQAGNPWAGCETSHGAGIGTFTIDSTNMIINIMVYKPVISDVGIKLVRSDGWALPEIKIPNTMINTWEVISFDFSGHMGNTYDQIVVFPDFDLGGRTGDNVCYFDHIYGDSTTACGPPPPGGPYVPVDYEASGYGATWTWTVFENDVNPPLAIVANPDTSGINCSPTVAEFTVLQAGNPWAGCETTHGAGIGTFTIDSTNMIINVMVYKPIISDVGIKLVRNDGWALPEIKVPNTMINTWEVISFDFSGHMGNTYDQIVVFPDFDLAGRAGDNICYFDNIWGDSTAACSPPPPVTSANVPVDYETPGYGATWTWTVFENDINPALGIVTNPDTSGINCSPTVAEFTALQAGNPWAGCETTHGAGIGTFTIDSTNMIINIMVYKPVISDVGLKLVRNDGWALPEIKVPNTMINTWEVISFDFSGHMGNTYDQIVVFPDFDLAGRAGDNVCYFDNIWGDSAIACSPPPPVTSANVPVDYETPGYGATWTWTVFENDINPALGIVTNPDTSGINCSPTVAEFTALQAGNPWAGCETTHGAGIGTFTIDSTNMIINIMVYKPVISDVGLKLVRNDGWALPEIKVPNTIINAWEVISFDFSGHMGNTYDQIVVFPDFDLAGRAGDNVCYFDNIWGDSAIACEPPPPFTGPYAPVDYELTGTGATWTWTVFENDSNTVLDIIPNPDTTGINCSPTVAQFTALQTGNPWAGVETMHGAGIGTFTIDSTNMIINIMVHKPVISDVGLKLVRNDGWALPEIKIPNTMINTWEVISFDFSGHIGNTYDQIVIFPDFDLAGRTQDNICYFDNIWGDTISECPPPPPAFNILAEYDMPACFGDSSGGIQLTVTDGVAPYSYLWGSGDTTSMLSDIPAGMYTVTVTDSTGTEETQSFTLVDPDMFEISSDVINPLCFGEMNGQIDLTVTGGNMPYTFMWDTGDLVEDLNGLGEGSYSVTVTDSSGCIQSETFNLVSPSLLEITSADESHLSCFNNQDGSIDLSLSGGTMPYSYVWSSGSTSEDPTGLDAGSHAVTVTDDNGCEVINTYSLTEPDEIMVTVSTSSENEGMLNGSANALVSGGTAPYMISWGTTPVQTGPDATALAAGSYEVTITDDMGCTWMDSVEVDLILGIGMSSEMLNVKVFPVPANNILNVQWDMLPTETVNLELYNLIGERVLFQSIVAPQNKIHTIDLETLPAGIYNLKISEGNKTSGRKVIVLR